MENILNLCAKTMYPQWFGEEHNGEVAISQYPGQTKEYQDMARTHAKYLLGAIYYAELFDAAKSQDMAKVQQIINLIERV